MLKATRALFAGPGLGRAARKARLLNNLPALPARPLPREDIDQTAELLENAPAREDTLVASYSGPYSIHSCTTYRF